MKNLSILAKSLESPSLWGKCAQRKREWETVEEERLPPWAKGQRFTQPTDEAVDWLRYDTDLHGIFLDLTHGQSSVGGVDISDELVFEIEKTMGPIFEADPRFLGDVKEIDWSSVVTRSLEGIETGGY